MCAYKMRYSTKPRGQIIKGYKFILFAKYMGKNFAGNINKSFLKEQKN